MPSLPTLNLPAPAQTAIVIAAVAVFLVILGWSIARALRPQKLIDVPVGPPVVDPNTAPEDLPAVDRAEATALASAAVTQEASSAAPPVKLVSPAPMPVAAAPVVSAVAERAAPDAPASATPEAPLAAPAAGQVGSDGDSEFVKLWPHQLSKIAVVAQALDNQWLTRNMLARMRRGFAQKPMGLADLQAERRQTGRAEYVRALLNSQQLVANRVFLYNTDYVAEDYAQQGEARTAFIELLNAGVIVPFVVQEHSPSETPVNVETTEAFTEWRRVCQNARVQTVRLDWDDTLNDQDFRQLNGRFTLWLLSLGKIDAMGDIAALAKSVGLTPEQIPAFQRRLKDVSRWAQAQEGVVYRGAFYREFITAPDTPIPAGIIDFDANRKPFAAELKQLADLSYATNLPDALGRYALTPMDSLPRTALQDLTIKFAQRDRTLDEKDLTTLLQREAFSWMNDGLFLSSMAHLDLRDIIELRATDEWAAYIHEMQGLLDDPLRFTDRSQAVSARYVALAERMTDRVRKQGKRDLLQRWTPVVKLVLTVGTASLSLWGDPFGPGVGSKILFSVSESAVGHIANLTARMIIGGVANRSAEAELETSLDFLRGRVEGARDAWKDIIGMLRSDTQHFEDRTEQPDRSKDELDPNINYQEEIEALTI